jgi:hypothetical protein
MRSISEKRKKHLEELKESRTLWYKITAALPDDDPYKELAMAVAVLCHKDICDLEGRPFRLKPRRSGKSGQKPEKRKKL